MVRAAVAERKLVRLVAGRTCDQLVAEADAEHVRAAEQLRDRLRLAVERLRVAGARREQDSVMARELVRVDVVRDGR